MTKPDLPRYCIVGERPVKAIETEDGGMDVQGYDWKTGDFVRAMNHLTDVMMPDGEVEVVTEAVFEAHVQRLRAQLLH